MSAGDLSIIDPDQSSWASMPPMPPKAVRHPLRDGFGKPIDRAIRLEKPNKHASLRTGGSVEATLQVAAGISHGGLRLATGDDRAIRQAPELAAKRLLDVVLGSLSLLLLSPMFLAIATAIKLQSDGPVFYTSERVGVGGRTFRCYKFRTMVRDAESLRSQLAHLNERQGILFKISNDPRVTPLGAMLRKYSLDELPQLINVLRGEMSLVGPRPPLACEVEQYEPHHLRRLSVLPGMTGLWQVEARSDPSFDSYVALDCKYAEDWSLWLDLKILARTFRVVFLGTGV